MTRWIGLLLAAVATLGGCAEVAGTPDVPAVSCSPSWSSACDGPEPAGAIDPLLLSADGYSLTGIQGCGHWFELTDQTPTRVTLTFFRQAMAPGAGSCTHVPLVVRLREPLGTRTVVDAVTSRPLPVTRGAA